MATGYILVDSPNPYTAQGTFPRRGGAQLSGTCIVHTSEGNWRGGVDALTNLVRTRADYGCYHRACDWEDIALYYPWEWESWQDSETNNWAVGISAACKTTDWGNLPVDVEEGYYRNLAVMAADFVTYMASKNIHVPLRRITGAQARARVPGFAAHGDSGISRSDPGANFDWPRFFKYTADVLNGAATHQSNPVQEDDMPTSQEVVNTLLNTPAYDGGKTVSEVLKGLFEHDFVGGKNMPEGKPLKDLVQDSFTAVRTQLATIGGKLETAPGGDVTADAEAIAKALAPDLAKALLVELSKGGV